jgi:iron complex outermembrane recepter protein
MVYSKENLMDIEVTSVSKRSEKLSETTSAIHVITVEDRQRSGASNIPEALRLADDRAIINEAPQESVKKMK